MDTNYISIIKAKVAALREKKQSLESEIASVVAELARLETTESVLNEITGGNIDVVSPVRTAAISSLGRTITKREQILSGALDLLKSGPRMTEDILDQLTKRGVIVSGDDRKTQMRNISSYLSRAKDDIGIEATRFGWTLKEQKALSDATDLSASQQRN